MGDNASISTSSRREFLKKLAKIAYVTPIVVSVSMLDEKLDMATARAQATCTCPPSTPEPE